MKIRRYISVLLACILLSPSVYAVQIRRQPGHRLPESFYPTDPDDPSLWSDTPNTFYARIKRAAAPGEYALSNIPRTGTIEYPVILVDFSDLTFITRNVDSLKHHYEQVFNEHGFSDTNTYLVNGHTVYGITGSVSDYFRDQSYGQFIPKFKIIGPVHLPKSYSYYGNGTYDSNAHIDEMIRAACDSVISGQLANLAGYALNGQIPQLSIIYAGRGENYNGSDPNTIWPCASQIYFNDRTNPQIYNSGIRRARYTCVCELYWDTDFPDGIGTFCHEFSHTLGLPDFYNTDTSGANDDVSNAAMGFWSLMDYGNYENEGFSPVGYTAFEKYSLGWMDLEEITYAGTYALNDISQAPNPESDIHSAYRLSTGNDDQFIILENHVKTGWYKFHKAQGLMVTAVDYLRSGWDDNKVNNYDPKHYRILPADNDYTRDSNAGDLFPYTCSDSTGTHVVDSISTRGKPQLKAGSSYPPFSIYNITRNQDQVTFRAGYDMPSNVENVKQQETTVTVYDISGKPVLKTTTSDPEHITLPGHGIFIVKYGNVTRKVSR